MKYFSVPVMQFQDLHSLMLRHESAKLDRSRGNAAFNVPHFNGCDTFYVDLTSAALTRYPYPPVTTLIRLAQPTSYEPYCNSILLT